MKLIYLGEELESNIEHELETTSKFGFDIVITYKEDVEYPDIKNTIHKLYNFTKIYNMDVSKVFINDGNIIFESSLHNGYLNYAYKFIESVEIFLSKRLRKKWLKSNI